MHDLACCASPPRIYSVNFCGTKDDILSSLKRVKPQLGEVGGGVSGCGGGVVIVKLQGQHAGLSLE